MKNVKRWIALPMCLITSLTLAACGSGGSGGDSTASASSTSSAAATSSSSATTSASATEDVNTTSSASEAVISSSGNGEIAKAKAGADTTFGIEPMAEPTTLELGFFAGSPLSYPFLFADKEGFFDELNISIDYQAYTNGNAMMEASSDWDIGGAGEGGLLAGMVGYDVHTIGITDYEKNIALFAREDSDLAKDPTNPDSWKGTTWLGPIGTTGQMVLVAALDKVGLTLNDVTCTNMDISSALTAFLGGEGDGLMVWNAVAFSAEDAGLVRVTDSGQDNVTCPCAMLATEDALNNKAELVQKAYAVFFKTVEWMYSSQDNFDKCVQYYLESCEDEGIKCDESVAQRVMEYYAPPKTLEASIELFEDMSPDDAGLYTERDLSQAEKDILVGMDFFISQGKYTNDQRSLILDDGLIDGSVAKAVQEMF